MPSRLKCDRGRPCNNCSRRHQTCRYYSGASTGKSVPSRASTTSELNRRLQHLEDLLVVLNNQQGREADTSLAPEAQGQAVRLHDRIDAELQDSPAGTISGPRRIDRVDRPAGSIFTDREGTSYVESSHWQAILDDIQDVRDFLQQNQSTNIPPLPTIEHSRCQGPALLFSGIQPINREDVIAGFPLRATVDRLVSRFFNSGEAAISECLCRCSCHLLISHK